jgi:hypothetical protein
VLDAPECAASANSAFQKAKRALGCDRHSGAGLPVKKVAWVVAARLTIWPMDLAEVVDRRKQEQVAAG